MRLLVISLWLLALAGPAGAALHPDYYRKAREEAAHVVVLDVERVERVPGRFAFGTCRVVGKVRKVERGDHYEEGGPIQVGVPCFGRNAILPSSGVLYQSADHLRASKAGRAFMTAPGELAMSQYEVLRTP